jgi:hypothetical protein
LTPHENVIFTYQLGMLWCVLPWLQGPCMWSLCRRLRNRMGFSHQRQSPPQNPTQIEPNSAPISPSSSTQNALRMIVPQMSAPRCTSRPRKVLRNSPFCIDKAWTEFLKKKSSQKHTRIHVRMRDKTSAVVSDYRNAILVWSSGISQRAWTISSVQAAIKSH